MTDMEYWLQFEKVMPSKDWKLSSFTGRESAIFATNTKSMYITADIALVIITALLYAKIDWKMEILE